MPFHSFIRNSRTKFQCSEGSKQLRVVCTSNIIRKNDEGQRLSSFVADKAPLYYRSYTDFINSLKDGFLITTLLETLERIPTSDHFQNSHFGEITGSIFVENIIGLKRLYSKLSLNTAENQNPYKMDILCYLPNTHPVNFVFCEVKSSPKNASDGLPAKHDKSCYADLFNTLKEYSESDKKFDFTCIKDNLENITDPQERELIRSSLKPYCKRIIGYVGIVVIDNSTYDSKEVELLGTRKSTKPFDVELLCVESYREVSQETYSRLKNLKIFDHV